MWQSWVSKLRALVISSKEGKGRNWRREKEKGGEERERGGLSVSDDVM